MMNSYEIEILSMDDDTEMITVQNALAAAGLDDCGDEDCSMYLKFNKERSVFVAPHQVGQAVQIINELGYETDEDAIESEDEG